MAGKSERQVCGVDGEAEGKMMTETEEEYRLQQFLKWKGGWETLYYILTPIERKIMFDRLKIEIEKWEREGLSES